VESLSKVVFSILSPLVSQYFPPRGRSVFFPPSTVSLSRRACRDHPSHRCLRGSFFFLPASSFSSTFPSSTIASGGVPLHERPRKSNGLLVLCPSIAFATPSSPDGSDCGSTHWSPFLSEVLLPTVNCFPSSLFPPLNH